MDTTSFSTYAAENPLVLVAGLIGVALIVKTAVKLAFKAVLLVAVGGFLWMSAGANVATVDAENVERVVTNGANEVVEEVRSGPGAAIPGFSNEELVEIVDNPATNAVVDGVSNVVRSDAAGEIVGGVVDRVSEIDVSETLDSVGETISGWLSK